MPVSGEIRNDLTLCDSALPTSTLVGLGIPGFPSPHRRAASHHVTPTTIVELGLADLKPIAKSRKRHPTKPTVRIEPEVVTAKHADKRDKRDNKEADALPSSNRWQEFEDLGLAPKPLTKKAQKLIVSTYRLIGFGILSLIVFVLITYIGTTAFYFLNHSWVTPVAISANDEKVVGLQSQRAAQLNERAKLVSDLAQAERSVRAEEDFQLQFAKAIKKDLAGRRVALGRVQQLAQVAASTRNEIRTTNGDYSASTASRMADEYKANMIDRNAMMQGKYQLAQISSANLSLAERQAEFDQRASELSEQTQSLDAILSDKGQSSALSYDILKIARDYEASKLAVARDRGEAERLRASIQRQDQILAGLGQSAYLRAVSEHATVAMVPYTNLDNVKKGTPLYGCKLDMLLCHQVGTVIEVLPGEVLVKHPHRDSMLRGAMVEMKMTDPAAAQDEVLFAGRPPLGI